MVAHCSLLHCVLLEETSANNMQCYTQKHLTCTYIVMKKKNYKVNFDHTYLLSFSIIL
jgi:hypothetical protein